VLCPTADARCAKAINIFLHHHHSLEEVKYRRRLQTLPVQACHFEGRLSCHDVDVPVIDKHVFGSDKPEQALCEIRLCAAQANMSAHIIKRVLKDFR